MNLPTIAEPVLRKVLITRSGLRNNPDTRSCVLHLIELGYLVEFNHKVRLATTADARQLPVKPTGQPDETLETKCSP